MAIWRQTWYLPVIALLLLTCSGNNDDPTGPDPNEPFPYATPPAGILSIDTTHLSDEGGASLQPGLCHALSGLFVFWIDANIVFRLAIPVGALAACLVRDPVYLGDLTWQWTASAGSGAMAHTDELTATITDPGAVSWSMRISGTQYELDRFLWFDGQVDTTAHYGEWHFYDYNSTASQNETVRIDWTVGTAQDEDVSLEIEIVDPNSEYFRDLLRSEVIGTQSSLVLLDVEADSTRTATVTWDRVTGGGMTINADGDSCCWASADERYADIDCP